MHYTIKIETFNTKQDISNRKNKIKIHKNIIKLNFEMRTIAYITIYIIYTHSN